MNATDANAASSASIKATSTIDGISIAAANGPTATRKAADQLRCHHAVGLTRPIDPIEAQRHHQVGAAAADRKSAMARRIQNVFMKVLPRQRIARRPAGRRRDNGSRDLHCHRPRRVPGNRLAIVQNAFRLGPGGRLGR
jgi:hypothetical protein